MNRNRFLIASGIYFIVSFVWGFLYHVTFFPAKYDAYKLFSNMADPDFALLIAGTVFESVVFGYLYQCYLGNQNKLKFATLLGVGLYLFASSYGIFQVAAVSNVQGEGLMSFIVFELVYMVLAGLAAGFFVSLADRVKV